MHSTDDHPRDITSEDCNVLAADFAGEDLSGAVVIDVRTHAEYQGGHLEGAVLINVRSREFGDRIRALDKSKQYYLYCKTGIRSAHAARIMRKSGFEKVCNVKGGIVALQKQGTTLVH